MESAPINKGNNNKKSLFTCFKPDMGVDDDEDSFKHARKRQKGNATPDPVLAYLSSADEDGVVVSSAAEEVEGEKCSNRRRKKGKGTWHSLRKALNDTALIKKIIRKWRTRKETMSRSNSHTETKIIRKQNTTRRTNSNASSTLGGNSSSAIFTPSSSLSSTSSSPSRADHVSGSSSHEINSPPLNGTSSKQNSVEDRRKRKCGSDKALCLLLIVSLLVLILWGKFFAILCTSVWFYLLPLSRRRKCKGEVSCVEESNEFDSVQYKKKVIMEGMLERKHSRVSLASMSKS